jgi:ectoine hydroxylase-related dioxygenase (phytanoyl-CoA dioxygenase family)
MLFMPNMERAGNSYQDQHQDYPHLLQSPRQVTFWIPLCKFAPSMGGISIYPGSHSSGLLPFKINEKNSHYEVYDLSQLGRPVVVDWDLYDIVVLDGMVVHGTVPNHCPSAARITQLFRYSDLSHPDAVASGWVSTKPTGNYSTSKELHADKLVIGY